MSKKSAKRVRQAGQIWYTSSPNLECVEGGFVA